MNPAEERQSEREARAPGWFRHLRNVLRGEEQPVDPAYRSWEAPEEWPTPPEEDA